MLYLNKLEKEMNNVNDKYVSVTQRLIIAVNTVNEENQPGR